MTRMDCGQARERIWSDPTHDEVERFMLAEHLALCPLCAEEERDAARLRQLLGRLPAREPTSDLRSSLRAVPGRERWRRRAAIAALPVAAGLCVAVSSLFWVLAPSGRQAGRELEAPIARVPAPTAHSPIAGPRAEPGSPEAARPSDTAVGSRPVSPARPTDAPTRVALAAAPSPWPTAARPAAGRTPARHPTVSAAALDTPVGPTPEPTTPAPYEVPSEPGRGASGTPAPPTQEPRPTAPWRPTADLLPVPSPTGQAGSPPGEPSPTATSVRGPVTPTPTGRPLPSETTLPPAPWPTSEPPAPSPVMPTSPPTATVRAEPSSQPVPPGTPSPSPTPTGQVTPTATPGGPGSTASAPASPSATPTGGPSATLTPRPSRTPYAGRRPEPGLGGRQDG